MFYQFPFLSPKLSASLLVCLMGVSLLGAGGCGRRNLLQSPSARADATETIDRELAFENITLEQLNDGGELVWKIKAEQATYSKDNKIAQVARPTGNLYRDGKLVYRFQAGRGEVYQDGEAIVLRERIVATSVEDGATWQGGELRWEPKADRLTVRDRLRGRHPQADVWAQEARIYSGKRLVELEGDVTIRAKDPSLQLQSEAFTWRMGEQKVLTDRSLAVDRYQEGRVSDRTTADRGELDLKTQLVTLMQNARMVLVDPAMEARSNLLKWDLKNQRLIAEQPVTLQYPQEEITLSADRGNLDITQQIVLLNGSVFGTARNGQSQLQSQQLTWNLKTETFTAQDSVVYTQASPPLTLRGTTAEGRIQEQRVIVSGGSERVVTEIVP